MSDIFQCLLCYKNLKILKFDFCFDKRFCVLCGHKIYACNSVISKLTLFFGELLRNFRNTLNINCLVLAFYLTNFRFIFLLAKHIIELSKDLVQSILQKFNYGKHRFCSTEATKSLVREYPKTSINSTFSRINFLNRLCLEYQNSKSVLIEVFEF